MVVTVAYRSGPFGFFAREALDKGPGHPLEILAAARTGGIEIVVGTNADEWLMCLEPGSDRDALTAWVQEHAADNADAVLAAVAA